MDHKEYCGTRGLHEHTWGHARDNAMQTLKLDRWLVGHTQAPEEKAASLVLLYVDNTGGLG